MYTSRGHDRRLGIRFTLWFSITRCTTLLCLVDLLITVESTPLRCKAVYETQGFRTLQLYQIKLYSLKLKPLKKMPLLSGNIQHGLNVNRNLSPRLAIKFKNGQSREFMFITVFTCTIILAWKILFFVGAIIFVFNLIIINYCCGNK